LVFYSSFMQCVRLGFSSLYKDKKTFPTGLCDRFTQRAHNVKARRFVKEYYKVRVHMATSFIIIIIIMVIDFII